MLVTQKNLYLGFNQILHMPPREILLLLLIVNSLAFSCGGRGSFTGFHTRSVQQYVEAGVPSPSGVWGLSEYSRCYDALRKITNDDFGALPRLKEETSKRIVLRMVARQNIDELQKELVLHRETAHNFAKVYRQILALYFGNDGKADYYHEEITSLLAFLVDYADVSFDSVCKQLSANNILSSSQIDNALLPAIDAYEREMTNLLEVQKAFNFSEDDLQKLANRIITSVILRKEMLPEDVRRRVGYKMIEVKEATIYRSIKDIYQDGTQKLE